jgi:O-antigen/teichoic acid export membrane protein
VLIAVNQQHYLTRAFILGVIFNVVGNLLFIPHFGYVGASIITILSELSLLVPFYMNVRANVGVVPWGSIFTRPLLATAAMGVTVYGLTQIGVNLWIATAVSVVVYLLVLWLLGVLHGEEMTVMRRALATGR